MGSCCRFRMLSIAHCKCSLRESSGGLPLEKLALSISGESDLQRLAGSRGSRVKDSGDGGPGACWSILNVPPALCLFFIFLYLLSPVLKSVCSPCRSLEQSMSESETLFCEVLRFRLKTSSTRPSPCIALSNRPTSLLDSLWTCSLLSLFSTFTLAMTVLSKEGEDDL